MNEAIHSPALVQNNQNKWWNLDSVSVKLPKEIVFAVCFISLLPFCLNLFGLDFGTPQTPLDLDTLQAAPTSAVYDALYQTLAGSFTHTILEWSAFCAAIFTVALAFVYFSVKHDVTTPIIGVTLVCAGMMDAFHTLAADHLIETVADNRNLIPFTWALCRMCNALLTILGVSIFLVGNPTRWKGSVTFVMAVSFAFGVMAYGTIHICATRSILPETMFPGALITRPWDVAPLILFAIAGIFIYPLFYRRYPSPFAHALIVSTIPNGATQLHMAFGSSALFDNDFNIAHFLKIIAYLVPLAGLMLDYSITQIEAKRVNASLSIEIEERKQVEKDLHVSEAEARENAQKLESALQDLQKTQAQLIQSEKMSSLGQLVGGVAHEINNPINFIHGNVIHAEQYVNDLLDLVMLYQAEFPDVSEKIRRKSQGMDLDFAKEDLPRLLHSMRLGTSRIQTIVRSLRNFSRLDEAGLKSVNIHEGIESTLMLLDNRLKLRVGKSAIAVKQNFGPLPMIECYPGQLNQVFMNILSNAIEALQNYAASQPTEFQPTIEIQTCMLSPEIVQLRFYNNGAAIAPEVRDKMFNPFFTTKPVGQGTGMGLSICYQIIEARHNGKIYCNPAVTSGAEFIIELPLSQPNLSVSQG